MTPAFSVVIPCRDRAHLLHRALASLDRQSFRDFETIVVDDGSREDLAAVAAGFPGLRVRLLAGRGRGANPARNLGTDAARAAYVAYLDSDDVFLPGKLASAARRIATDPADLLVSGGYVWRSGGSVQVKPGRRMAPGEDISEFYFAAGERFLTSSWVVRTAVAPPGPLGRGAAQGPGPGLHHPAGARRLQRRPGSRAAASCSSTTSSPAGSPTRSCPTPCATGCRAAATS